MSSQGVLAGWALADITPPVPCWLGGYAARHLPCRGVHDRLFARALALGSSHEPLVLVICDLVAIDASLARAIRHRVGKVAPRATVWVAATHTHSGPDVGHVFANASPDASVEARIIDGAVQAGQAAIRGMQPVVAKFGSGGIRGVGGNRAHPERSVDLRLNLVCLQPCQDARSKSAVFGNFACHPTVLGPENLEISADLPGAFVRQLLCEPGSSTQWAVLATGAAGDISTRHLRHAQTFTELERVGHVLADRAVEIIESASALELATPHLESDALHLEPGNCSEPGLEAEISVARIGELTLASVPGELFHDLGTAVAQHHWPTMVLGYTDGYLGYIPTEAAYANADDYEIQVTHLAPGQGERLVSHTTQLIDRLWSSA